MSEDANTATESDQAAPDATPTPADVFGSGGDKQPRDRRGPGTDAQKPIAEMTDAERASYFEAKAERFKRDLRERSDYDEHKANSEKYTQMLREQETQHEKALREAREEAVEQGRREARSEANDTSVRNFLGGAMAARGKAADDIERELSMLNLSAFVNDDGSINQDLALSAIDRAAPIPPNSTPQWDGFGQGEAATADQQMSGKDIKGKYLT